MRRVCSPLSTVFAIAGKQREDFLLASLTTVLLSVTVAIPYYTASDPLWIVVAFAACYSFTYALYLIRGYQHAVK